MLLEAPQLPRVLIFNKGSTVSQSTMFTSHTYLKETFKQDNKFDVVCVSIL